MDEKMLSLEQEIKIKEKALKLKEEKKLRKICPMVVFGDTANGEKSFLLFIFLFLHSKHNVRQPIAVYGNLFISLNYKYIS